MDNICPLCNNLYNIPIPCTRCTEFMKAQGAIQDYFDDYSPYLDYDITSRIDGADKDNCVHLYSCMHCGHDTRISIAKVYV
jgi:hypothetical protein